MEREEQSNGDDSESGSDSSSSVLDFMDGCSEEQKVVPLGWSSWVGTLASAFEGVPESVFCFQYKPAGSEGERRGSGSRKDPGRSESVSRSHRRSSHSWTGMHEQ